MHPDFTGPSAAPRISKRRAPLQTDGKGLAPYAGCLSKKAPSGGIAGPAAVGRCPADSVVAAEGQHFPGNAIHGSAQCGCRKPRVDESGSGSIGLGSWSIEPGLCGTGADLSARRAPDPRQGPPADPRRPLFRPPDTDPLAHAVRTVHHLDCRARRTKYRPQKTQPMTGPTLVIDPGPDAGPVCQHKKGVPGRGRRASGRGGETRSLKDGRPSV